MTAPIAELNFPGGRLFQVVLADLLQEETDGIVNAANNQLTHGGGVAAAIARAAGQELETASREIVRRTGPIATGEAVATVAGKLPFKGVINTVGPRHGEGEEEAKLISAVQAACIVADGVGW